MGPNLVVLLALVAGLFSWGASPEISSGSGWQPARISATGPTQGDDLLDGAALFASRCMLCHGPGGRASQQEALARLSMDSVYKSMTDGVMREQAAGLSDAERRAIAEFLATGGQKVGRNPAGAACEGAQPENKESSDWNGWSPDLQNQRWQSGAKAKLTRSQIGRLRLKWAFAFPGLATAANQVTVSGGRLYVGSWNGTIYALNPRTACSYWVFKADSGVRVPVVIHNGLAMFADFQANAYAVDVRTGKLRWRLRLDEHPQARVTGPAVAYKETLYVPISSLEEGVAADPQYPCCTFRGSVVAVNIESGKQRWKSYTIPEPPKKVGMNRVGTPKFGPSGVAVWSAPTIDLKRGALYVTTGNNYSEGDSPTADAVIAIDLNNGAQRWVRQTRPSDRWNAGCLFDKEKVNCPEREGPDYDFGAPPVLVQTSSGSDLILAGQKSGVLFALDPDREGAVVWETRVGKGGNLGGIEWGMAADSQRAYVAIADWNVGSTVAEGTLNAVALSSGKVLWTTPNPPTACEGKANSCSTANAAPVTALTDVLFLGSLDGRLRVYDADDGKILWEYDTNREFEAINGGKVRGGSVNAAGTTVADGLVFQTSGYGAFGLGMPGNVLLAFGLSESNSEK